MRQILIFLALLALAPIAGALAVALWLLAVGVVGGFGFAGAQASDFVDPRTYAPFARAMFYATPLAYFPAYTLGRLSTGGLSLLALAIAGIVASLFPAVLLALDDQGRLLEAARALPRFGNEVFELETLLSWSTFSASSSILTAAYWCMTKSTPNSPARPKIAP